MEEALLAYRTKKRWTLFVTCPLNSEGILFGLDWLIGFRKEHIYGAMDLWSSFNSSVSGKWLGELARNVSENKCVEILGNGSSLTDCCKKNKYFICEKARGELPQKKIIWQRCSSNILHVYEDEEGKVVDWASFRGLQSKMTDIRVVKLSVMCIESVLVFFTRAKEFPGA